ncbi:DUF1971 domain-containing protein [Neisseria sp.]|uniref:DUF1971 domain-containing protein n=1 Tax=Neisseria sp. TaxID=192066 RepID=UPI0035A17970
MHKTDLFVSETDLADYVPVREYPDWTSRDLPQQIVAAPFYARLRVIRGSFLFRAYDEHDQIIYAEVFSPQNQQTLLKPNIRHTAAAQGEPFAAQLTLFAEKTD